MNQTPNDAHPSIIPGNVLVTGSGFLVTSGAWLLFGFLEGEFGSDSATTLFFILAALHALVGVTLLRRRPTSVPAGIGVALVGLAVAGFNLEYVLMFTNTVILVLLILSRGNVVKRS